MNRAIKVLFVFILSLCFTSSNVYSGEMADGFNEEDFIRTAEEGFDNPQNNYAFSIAKFKGDTYVGTGRNFLFRVFEVLKEAGILPPDYEYRYITAPEGEAWSKQRANDMCAEIWRFRKSKRRYLKGKRRFPKGKWEKVYRSAPMDVSDLGIPNASPENAFAAKEPGFRSMITFTDKWGDEAIYAASAASIVPGRLLLKSIDGTSWEEVKTDVSMESDSRSLAVHNGKLYVGPAGISQTATIWATDDPVTTGDGTNWEKVADFTDEAPGRNVAITSMASLNGHLYAGTQNDEGGFQVWKSNAIIPSHPELGEWTRIIDSGAGDLGSTRALTMAVFKDNLYVGTSMFPLWIKFPWILPPKGFELIRIYSDDTWDLLIGDYIAQKPQGGVPTLRIPKSGWPGGFGNFLNIYCWTLHVANGVLYLGSFDMSSFLYVLLQNEATENSAVTGYLNTIAQSMGPIGHADGNGMLGPMNHILGAFNTGNPVLIPETTWQEIHDILYRFGGADVWKSRDGILWEPVTLNGFGNPENYGIRTMLKFRSFFIGTANPFGGLEMLQAHPGKSRNKNKRLK